MQSSKLYPHPKIYLDMQTSKTLRDAIICTPPVTSINFSCNSSGSTVCQVPKPVTDRIAFCRVRRNETVTTTVTIKNKIGRFDTKTETTGNYN